MRNEKDKSIFDFWLVYEKLVGTLPEKIIENPELDTLKKAIMTGEMADVSFGAVILPFSNRKKQQDSFRNMVDILISVGKIEDFDYNKYYAQYLEKQNQQNKELPLTDFVQILIDDNKIPAIDYKEYEEKVLNKRVNSDKLLNQINVVRSNQEKDNNVKSIAVVPKKIA